MKIIRNLLLFLLIYLSLTIFCFGKLKIERSGNQQRAIVYCDKCGISKEFFFDQNATKEYISQNVYLKHDNLINNWETRYLKDINVQIELPVPLEQEIRKDETRKPFDSKDVEYWIPYIEYIFKKVDTGDYVYILNPITVKIYYRPNENQKNLRNVFPLSVYITNYRFIPKRTIKNIQINGIDCVLFEGLFLLKTKCVPNFQCQDEYMKVISCLKNTNNYCLTITYLKGYEKEVERILNSFKILET